MTTFFRHYKNRYYQIVGEALDTRDDTLVVVYRTLYPSEYPLFTRPKEEFFGSARSAAMAAIPSRLRIALKGKGEDA